MYKTLIVELLNTQLFYDIFGHFVRYSRQIYLWKLMKLGISFGMRQDQESWWKVLPQLVAATIEIVASSSKSLIDSRVTMQISNTSSLIRSTF